MKKLIESIKQSKAKMIVLCACVILLIVAIITFAIGRSTANSLKNPDKSAEALLAAFYTEDYNKGTAEILLGDTYTVYFGSIKDNLYKEVYQTLSELGDGALILGKDAVTIANEYVDNSLALLKRVKSYEIVDKQEVDNGYRYELKITPVNLNDVYQKGNECAAEMTEKIKTSDPIFAEMANHEYAIYYYCLAQGMANGGQTSGTAKTVNITLQKNDKGQYIPDEDSLSALMSAAY